PPHGSDRGTLLDRRRTRPDYIPRSERGLPAATHPSDRVSRGRSRPSSRVLVDAETDWAADSKPPRSGAAGGRRDLYGHVHGSPGLAAGSHSGGPPVPPVRGPVLRKRGRGERPRRGSLALRRRPENLRPRREGGGHPPRRARIRP